ncbi:hypothetical protein ACM40_08060 [Chryseobacterium sp. BLS98]|nr:hypothetical protein ACM40_08060 [Chryseobacterium sp. BLS98]
MFLELYFTLLRRIHIRRAIVLQLVDECPNNILAQAGYDHIFILICISNKPELIIVFLLTNHLKFSNLSKKHRYQQGTLHPNKLKINKL